MAEGWEHFGFQLGQLKEAGASEVALMIPSWLHACELFSWSMGFPLPFRLEAAEACLRDERARGHAVATRHQAQLQALHEEHRRLLAENRRALIFSLPVSLPLLCTLSRGWLLKGSDAIIGSCFIV